MKKPKAKWFHSRIEIGVNLLLNGQNMFRTRTPYCQSSAKLHIIPSSCHPIILSSFHPVIQSSRQPAIWSSSHPVILSSLLYHHVILSSCHPVFLLSCYRGKFHTWIWCRKVDTKLKQQTLCDVKMSVFCSHKSVRPCYLFCCLIKSYYFSPLSTYL